MFYSVSACTAPQLSSRIQINVKEYQNCRNDYLSQAVSQFPQFSSSLTLWKVAMILQWSLNIVFFIWVVCPI